MIPGGRPDGIHRGKSVHFPQVKAAVLMVLLGCASCTPAQDTRNIRIDLRTDLVPLVEFESIRLSVGDGELSETTDHIAGGDIDYIRGTRLRTAIVAPGTLTLRATLFRAGGAIAAEKHVSVEIGSHDLAVTLVLTRSCRGVECPATGNPSYDSCLGGRCVDPRCAPETPEFCPLPECSAPSECSVASCADAVCTGGTCLARPALDRCERDQYCDGTLGCRQRSDPPPDVGPADAALDRGGSDAGADAADTNIDAGPMLDPIFAAVSNGADVGGDKDGGLAWGDFNEDGCLDLLVNTAEASVGSLLLMGDCTEDRFQAVNETHAAGLSARYAERSVIFADLNNDGYVDIVRNGQSLVEIYFNGGPAAEPAYSFGIGEGQSPNLSIRSWTGLGELNVEGIGAADFDNDGDLDLIVDNNDNGIALMLNDDGDLSQLPAIGLPGATSSADGDYLAVVDLDGDGNMDVLSRKGALVDFYYGNGDGTFTAGEFDERTSNGNKGGITPCDIDGDGLFDLFWTDEGTNQFWRQTSPRVFEATGEPSSGIAGNIDDASCGDVDNDGDMDLFLSSDGADPLFLNDGTGIFVHQNRGIDSTGDGEGSQFADYDGDGDLDLAVNTSGGNQLWRNETNDTHYLRVFPAIEAGTGSRPALGATARITAVGSSFEGPLTQLDGGSGHGVSGPGQIHLGLADGPDVQYQLTVRFPGGTTVVLCVQPSALPGQELEVLPTTPGSSCD